MMLGGSYSLSEVLMVSAIMATLVGLLTYELTGSLKAAVIVGVSAFVLSFIALGGVGLTMAAITGGTGVATSPQLLSPNTWQRAERMLLQVLRKAANMPELMKNTKISFEQGMRRGRIPDFVAKGRFIADSKWRQTVSITDQLRDFEVLAKKWEVPLYIFVCKGTHVSDSVVKLVARTNGLIIRIFK